MVDNWIPSAVFGVLSLLSGLIAIMLPETTNTILPDAEEKEDELKEAKSNVSYINTEDTG